MQSHEIRGDAPPSSGNKESFLELLKERREPSLGELNPLLFPPDLSRPETVEALLLSIERGIEKYGGKKPEYVGTTGVEVKSGESSARFVARWTLPLLDERQVSLLEKLITHIANPHSVLTRKGIRGIQRRKPSYYPRIEVKWGTPKKKRYDETKIGWCMGPTSGEADHTCEGLFLYREVNNKTIAASMIAERNHDWFTFEDPVDYRSTPVKTQHIIEARISDLYQTELVKFVLQTAQVLAGKEPIDSSKLTYDVYQSLNRLGLKRRRLEDIYGLNEVMDHIERYLFFPLRNLEKTVRRGIEVSSVLLIGVPGTGKTLLAEYFLQQDVGVFLVPFPAEMLAKDITKEKKLIDRISSVSQETDISTVIQVDDIESVGSEEASTVNSILMNLMAGVRERGFFVLASTNNPYELSYQLLQPERFGHILHIPLPEKEARFGILKIHAPEEYFADLKEREAILQAVASQTKHFDSRLLKALCDNAQINAMYRESHEAQLTVEDFEEALSVAKRSFNEKEAIRREEELAEFANRHRAIRLGFRTREEPLSGEVSLRDLMQEYGPTS